MTSQSLDAKYIKLVQDIVMAVLFYVLAVDNKLLVSINSIVNQQFLATLKTNEAINHFLDYLATYPNEGIVYRSINMVLAVHSYVVFHNESKGLSQAGYHIFLDEDEPFPQWNVPILTIFQVINFVMSSAAES